MDLLLGFTTTVLTPIITRMSSFTWTVEVSVRDLHLRIPLNRVINVVSRVWGRLKITCLVKIWIILDYCRLIPAATLFFMTGPRYFSFTAMAVNTLVVGHRLSSTKIPSYTSGDMTMCFNSLTLWTRNSTFTMGIG